MHRRPPQAPFLPHNHTYPKTAPGGSDVAKAWTIVGFIVGGLLFDQKVEFWGQTLTNLAMWVMLLYWLRRTSVAEQTSLVACVLYATIGEIFLSLVWGLYEYRLGNIPLFVPPGHALLFMLGAILAARARDWIVWFTPIAAVPFVCLLLLSGTGTLDALLFAIFLLCLVFGRAKKLYAVMFVLSLAMEIYGTWLGNWAWKPVVPWLALTTVNPPLAAGAFYSVLDMLVVATASKSNFSAFHPRRLGPFRDIRQFFPVLRPAARLSARNAHTVADT
jgi:hypothetical protein